jgi:multidrug resistance efflux pump
MSPLVLIDSHNGGTPEYVQRDSPYWNKHPIRSMNTPKVDWNRTFEFAWRILVFVVAVGTIAVVSTNWTRCEGAPGWQRTNDAYPQADLTPISAKVPGYVRELPIQDYERVHKGQVLAQLFDDNYRAAVEQAEAGVATALAQTRTLIAQHDLQFANVMAARAVVASTAASLEQNGRDVARQRRLLATGSSSIETSEKLDTDRVRVIAQLAQNRAQTLAAERQLAVLEAQIAQSESTVAAQRAALDAHDQFLADGASNLDLLTTEQSLVALDATVASSDAALIRDQIAVFKTLGGGWRDAGE